MILALAGPSLSARIATFVYPSLDQPWSRENAPTPTSFPASADIRAVIGGRGEGLSCSIPAIAGRVLFGGGGQAPVSLMFRQACAFHDFCYRHGHATYTYSKSDCDVLLQEYAYRLCRQSYGDVDPGQDTCRERARVVLLGVDLFGGESFAHGHNSTYFEFDPYPQRANDYVAARLAAAPPRAVPGTSLTERATLWWLAFKDGWMVMRHRRPGENVNTGAVPFLREKIPVPPMIVRGSGQDRFVWIARRSLANTGIYAFSVDASSPDMAAMALQDLVKESAAENTRCDTPTISKGVANLQFDCGTSMTRPVTVDCPDGSTRTLLVTVGHMGTRWPTQRTTTADRCRSSQEIALAPTQLKVAPLDKNTYWFAQTDFLVGHFEHPATWDVIAFGRGHHGDGAETTTGVDYENRVLEKSWSVESSVEPPWTIVDIPEALEPLAPFRADGETTDRVIAVHSPCSEQENCRLEIREWLSKRDDGGKKSGTHLDFSLTLTHDWLRQPAQVVQARDRTRGDWLVFSRINSSRGSETMNDPAFVPERVRLEYQSLRRTDAGWKPVHAECVDVDLRDQLQWFEGSPLVRRYLPAGLPSSLPSSPPEDSPAFCVAASAETIQRLLGTPATLTQPVHNALLACAAMRRDAAARWHRSQMIPGYVFEDVRTSDPALDAVFVFNGFPGQSIRVHDGRPVEAPWARACPAQ